MCLTCTDAWCNYCATRAVWLLVTNTPTDVVVLQACRGHVDEARELMTRKLGARPNVTEIPHQRAATR